jgi:hypothetical protein
MTVAPAVSGPGRFVCVTEVRSASIVPGRAAGHLLRGLCDGATTAPCSCAIARHPAGAAGGAGFFPRAAPPAVKTPTERHTERTEHPRNHRVRGCRVVASQRRTARPWAVSSPSSCWSQSWSGLLVTAPDVPNRGGRVVNRAAEGGYAPRMMISSLLLMSV